MKRSPLYLIWITVFIDLVGFGIVIPILPLYAQRHGASPTQLGALLASYSVMQFIFAPVLGTLSDRVGRKPVLAISLLGTAAASVLLGAASQLPHALWLLFAARTLDGITGANVSTAQAYIADVTPPERRARALGLVGMAFGLGFVLGPAIGGVLAGIDIALPFYAVGALALTNAIVMMWRLPEPERHISVAVEARSRFSRLSEALRNGRTGLLLVTFLLVTVAFAFMESTLSLLLADRFGYEPASAAYVFAFIGLVMAAVQGGLVGRLAERVGERPLVVLGIAMLGAAMLLLGLWLPPTTALLLGVLALLAAGIGLHNTAVTTLVSRNAPPATQGTTLGLTQSMSSIGRILGYFGGGALYTLGNHAPYLAGAALVAAALGATLYRNATVEPMARGGAGGAPAATKKRAERRPSSASSR
jgi:MFS transporter, DHA1 family, tetracycline resistance protein